MAIDFNSLAGVEEVAREGKNLLDTRMDKREGVDAALFKLNYQIKIAQAQEQAFLAKLRKPSKEAFKQDLAAYYARYNLNQFTGIDLKSTVTKPFQEVIKGKTKQLNKNAEIIFKAYLIENTKKSKTFEKIVDNKNVRRASADKAVDEFLKAFSVYNTGTLKSTRAFNFKQDTKNMGLLEVIATEGTELFKENVKAALKDYEKGSGIKKMGISENSLREAEKNVTAKINGPSQVEFGTKFAAAISFDNIVLTKAKVEKLIEDKNSGFTRTDLDLINLKIVDEIIQKLNLGNLVYNTFVKNRLKEMLAKDPYMFLVGQAENSLAGILGEISAVIALTALLGDNYSSAVVDWIGSQPGTTSKKQPSIDIVLKNIGGADYGIQVKNTTADLTIGDFSHKINFSDTDLSTVLDNAGLSGFENVYISDTYNVPYQKTGGIYKQVGYNAKFKKNDDQQRFDEYVDVEKEIDYLVQQMNQFLTEYAADFLYMANPDFSRTLASLDADLTSKLRGNFMYIVGNQVYFVTDMLEPIYDELLNLKKQQQPDSFQLSTYFEKKADDKKGAYNIVAWKNTYGNKSLSANQKINSLSDRTIKMRSSYVFKS